MAPLPLKIGIALLAAFAMLTALVGLRVMAPLDARLIALSKVVTSNELDLVVGVINYVAAAELSLLMMTVLAWMLWRRGLAPNRAVAPLMFLVSLPIEMVLKFTLPQPVPSSQLYRRTITYALFGLPTMQSYPSGHATRTAFMAVLLGYILWRWLGPRRAWPVEVLLVVTVPVFAWSRAYLGYHWPMDMVGGILLGSGVACLAIAMLAPARGPDRTVPVGASYPRLS